jgi:hypothetical protein
VYITIFPYQERLDLSVRIAAISDLIIIYACNPFLGITLKKLPLSGAPDDPAQGHAQLHGHAWPIPFYSLV